MEGLTLTQFMWVTIIVGGLIGVIVLTRAPEMLVVILMVASGLIQYVFLLFGYPIDRRTFATAGAIIFIPLVLLFFVMRMAQTREKEPIIGRPNFSFVVTAIVMGVVFLVGLAYTMAPRYGSQKTGEYFIFGMAPMFLSFVFLRDLAGVRRFFMWLLLIPAVIISFASVYTLATQGTLFVLMGGEIHATETGVFDIPGHGGLSSAALMFMSAILALAAGRKDTKWKVFPLLALPVAAFYILFAGTRSNFAAFLFVATVGVFFAYKGRRTALVVALLVLLITATVLFALAPEDVRERMLSSWFEEETSPGGAFKHRLDLAEGCVIYALQAPILGYGTGSWVMLEYGVDEYDYPHNMAAEVLVENGIVGLAVFLVLCYLVLRRIWRLLRDAEVGTELYGLAVFGTCLMAMEFFTGMAHFGLAHHSCTLLISSAVILRMTYLAERAGEHEVSEDEERGAVAVLHARL